MAQQRILKLVEMPEHTPENPSLNEQHIARHNLIDAKGLSPTGEELKAEETRLLEEYKASQYQRNRKFAYDPIPEQLDQIYHDIDGWKKRIKAVKDKFPKP